MNLEEQVINLYKQGNSQYKVAELVGIKRDKVKYILQKNKIPSDNIYKKYTIGDNYFNQIDSEEKAYWLGFLFADGSVRNNEKEFEFALNYKDEYHIQKMLNCMGSNHIIYKTREDLRRVVIWSPQICKDLINYGCIPNKSLVKEFPYNKISNDLIHHFIRGYFDGNGYICLDTYHNQYTIGFSSTKEFLTGIILNLDLHYNKMQRNGDVNNYNLKYAGNNVSKKALNKLYSNATIYLDRKYQLYLEVLQTIPQKTRKEGRV